MSPHACHAQRGLAVIAVLFIAFLLVAVVGLAVDTGHVITTGRELQSVADASALAAAARLAVERRDEPDDTVFDTTRQVAIDVAGSNRAANVTVVLDANAGNAASGDVVVGAWDAVARTFTATTTFPDAVRVHARRTGASANGALDLYFGKAFGVPTSDVQRRATARVIQMDPRILVLDPTKRAAMRLNGTPALLVPGGRVHVNSTASCGYDSLGTTQLVTGLLSVCGTACYPAGKVNGEVQDYADPIPDPLAWLLPDMAAWNAFRDGLPEPLGASGAIATSGTFDPGHYPGGMNLSASDVVTLLPGIYVIGDNGIDLKGSAFVEGDGVCLLIDRGGDVDVGGSDAGLRIGPPTSGPFTNVALFTHRFPTGKQTVKLAGGGLLELRGTIYVPSGHLDVGGQPARTIGAIIANTVEFSGTATYTMTGENMITMGLAPQTLLVD